MYIYIYICICEHSNLGHHGFRHGLFAPTWWSPGTKRGFVGVPQGSLAGPWDVTGVQGSSIGSISWAWQNSVSSFKTCTTIKSHQIIKNVNTILKIAFHSPEPSFFGSQIQDPRGIPGASWDIPVGFWAKQSARDRERVVSSIYIVILFNSSKNMNKHQIDTDICIYMFMYRYIIYLRGPDLLLSQVHLKKATQPKGLS